MPCFLPVGPGRSREFDGVKGFFTFSVLKKRDVMWIPLNDAPLGEPLLLARVTDVDLDLRLQRMGLFQGSEIVRLDQEVLIQSIRVAGPRGEVVLGGGMAMKTVVHLDDGRRLPLAEVKPGECGHIEGLTGGSALSRALDVLGLKSDDCIRVSRRLPPMEYAVLVEPGNRVMLTDGMAAKVWGKIQERFQQLVTAAVGRSFLVVEILGGYYARKQLGSHGIEPRRTIVLETVAGAQVLRHEVRNPVVVVSRGGLRLFLRPREGERIFVWRAGTEKTQKK